MKNYFKVLGIIVLAMIIGFSMTACSDDDNNSTTIPNMAVTGGGGSNITMTANNLTLAGQVFKEKYTMTGVDFIKYTGTKTLESIGGGSGGITNGVLNYTINVPTELWEVFYLDQEELYNLFLSMGIKGWTNLTVNQSDVKYFAFHQFSHTGMMGEGEHYKMRLLKYNIIGNWSNATETMETITFIYVDKAVTISGTGQTKKNNYNGESYTEKTESFNINLTVGWNAICSKYISSYSGSNLGEMTETISRMNSIGNTFTWVLGEW